MVPILNILENGSRNMACIAASGSELVNKITIDPPSTAAITATSIPLSSNVKLRDDFMMSPPVAS
ncbi:hypothetical protein D3C80_1990630 [compost metagenome]